jgi:hypothetical protein
VFDPWIISNPELSDFTVTGVPRWVWIPQGSKGPPTLPI